MLRLCRKKSAGRSAFPPKRLMHSTGHNIVTVGVPNRNRQYISDLYTTLIDIKWRWNILIFFSGFVLTWLAFACFYYLLGYLHGDLEKKARSSTLCLTNVRTFTGAYLFSIETMTTIGYGSRAPTEECPGVFLAVMLQSIIGAGLQFALASVVVSKTRRAKRRSETILFSSQVCICEQDNRLQLSVRVGDMRKSEISGSHAQGFLIKKLRFTDGTLVPVRSFALTFKGENKREDIFFPWPTLIQHEVNEDSPLWSLSRDDFLKGEYELIVVLDGICGTNGNSFQARKSYHTCEFKWGYRFTTLNLSFAQGSYVMDLSNFHHTVSASTPLCSAQDLTHLRELYQANHINHQHTQINSSANLTTQTSVDDSHKEKNKSTVYSSTQSLSQSPSSSNSKASIPAPHLHAEARRSHSLEEDVMSELSVGGKDKRRCSMGDLIRAYAKESTTEPKKTRNDAFNIYRHRRSVTDTYLGAGLEEEMEDNFESSEAILSIVSQRSEERRTDMREVFKRRRSSVLHLYFGTEISSSDTEETTEETLDDMSQG